MTTLSEKDFKLFKKWLKSHLAFGPVTITFTKKDGSERVMECTTSPSLVPFVEEPVHVTNTDNPIDFPVPKSQAMKQLGNSVAVTAIQDYAEKILEALKKKYA
jgi:site-specific DNA-cytosine methylase